MSKVTVIIFTGNFWFKPCVGNRLRWSGLIVAFSCYSLLTLTFFCCLSFTCFDFRLPESYLVGNAFLIISAPPKIFIYFYFSTLFVIVSNNSNNFFDVPKNKFNVFFADGPFLIFVNNSFSHEVSVLVSQTKNTLINLFDESTGTNYSITLWLHQGKSVGRILTLLASISFFWSYNYYLIVEAISHAQKDVF